MTGRRAHLAGRGRAVAACPGCSHGGRFGKTDASFPHKDVNRVAGRLPSGWRSFWGGLEIEATDKVLVLFSGGQDSATCLAWALSRFACVETVAFDYGQRHGIELEVRRDFLARVADIDATWGPRLGADHLLDLGALGKISETALTRDVAIGPGPAGLPNTFVPGRNLIFVTLAAALAWRRGLGVIVGGMCETDYSGYPDCRDDALQKLAEAIRLGMDTDIRLETPLMWLDKAATWQLAQDTGGDRLVEAIVEDTHTCYLGERGSRQAWGHGCGACPACELRRKGWETWQRTVKDC
jgi:7-cyano-7-deazaguanine synthase